MKIVLFDGDCNLCNSYVQFIIENDHKDLFKFASLQSEFGQDFLEKNHYKKDEFFTLILIDEYQFYTKSNAVLRIVSELKGYSWVKMMFVVPAFFRNCIYDFVAKRRHLLFKDKNNCMLPSKRINQKFISQKES